MFRTVARRVTGKSSRRVGLTVEGLESRVVPANTITMVNDLTPSLNIDTTTVGTTLTYSTTAANAQLSIADIEAGLRTFGVTAVVVSTAVAAGGTDGGQTGDIVWDLATVGRNLDFTNFGTGKTLALRTDATATRGDIDLTGLTFAGSFGNGAAFAFDAAGPGGAVRFLGTVAFDPTAFASSIEALTVAAGAFSYNAGQANVVGNISISAAAIALSNIDLTGNGSLVAGGNVTLTGPVTLLDHIRVRATGPASAATFAGAVDGAFDLDVSARTMAFPQAVGATTPLATLTFSGGNVTFGSNAISAATIAVGNGFFSTVETTFGSGTGTVTGNVIVESDGNLTPGGVGSVGTLTVVGNVTFNGGDFSPDLGAVSDLLAVTGNIDITSGNLGGGIGMGALAGAGNVQVISFTGTLTGIFGNAPLGGPVIVGSDAVAVTNYGPAATGITIARAPAAAGNVVSGAEFDGTGYTARLTGPGQLVGVTGPGGDFSLVARNTNLLSILSIVTRANASDNILALDQVIVQGSLASFTAPKADINSRFLATGPVRIVSFRDLTGGGFAANANLDIGGTAAERTTIAARNAFGDITSTAGLTAVTLRGTLGGVLRAPSIGVLRAPSVFGRVTIAGAITSVAVASGFNSTLTAGSLGSFTAGSISGTMTVAGAIGSIATAGSFNGTLSAASLRSLSAGSVNGSVTATGTITAVTTTNEYFGSLNAASLGTARIGTTLSAGFGGTGGWNVTNGIGSLTAGAINNFNLTATFLTTLSVVGSLALDLSGDVTDSTFTLAGNSGGVGRYGLRTAVARGTVRNTTFEVEDGNVLGFTVGRFIDSNLYLDYTPAGTFDAGTPFDTTTANKLTAFATTATTLNNPNNPNNFAFQGSQIAADTIGTVRLSGLKTANGTPFGIKFHTAGGSVRTATSDSVAIPLNANLTPGAAALAGNFFFLNV